LNICEASPLALLANDDIVGIVEDTSAGLLVDLINEMVGNTIDGWLELDAVDMISLMVDDITTLGGGAVVLQVADEDTNGKVLAVVSFIGIDVVTLVN